jgi:hypothetical protein
LAGCNQPTATSALTPKAASLVPPEDGRFKPETYRRLKHKQIDCESESVLSWLRYFYCYYFDIVVATAAAPVCLLHHRSFLIEKGA